MMSMMRTLMAASSAESGKVYQQLLINGKWLLRRQTPAPSTFDECACSVAFNCPNMWSAGLIVCYNGDNCTVGSVAWNTPGIVLACTAIESILTTDYRCFYDQTCINMLLSVYNFDMPKRLPLPAATLAITAMNSSKRSRFSTRDTMGTLIGELLLEEWEIHSNFEGYYETCAPSSCTYTVTQRLDTVYVVATILGLYGGLAILFRLAVPRCVQLVHLTVLYWRSRNSDINGILVLRGGGKKYFAYQH
ncbi:unnamed protein product [Rotaria sp. Silwood1]|nr:unnamed protein product [Rotaria sp. Silwood1]